MKRGLVNPFTQKNYLSNEKEKSFKKSRQDTKGLPNCPSNLGQEKRGVKTHQPPFICFFEFHSDIYSFHCFLLWWALY